MKKSKIIIFALLILFGISLNVYYYWNFLWTIWAKHYIRDQDIIIALTTSPQRINELEEPLDCLSRQNFKARQIYLSLPYTFKRNNSEYVIPDWLDSYPGLTVLRTEDYGPATKILGALKNAPITDDTIIIAVDDDTCYPPNLVLELAARAKMYPDQAIVGCGSEIDFDKNKISGVVKIFKDHFTPTFLEGFAGIAYRRKFFDESIYEIKDEPQFCFNSDDLYISHHFAKRKITSQIVNNRFFDVRRDMRQLAFGFADDALFKIGSISQADRYRQCLTYLQAKFPDVVFNDNGIKG